MNDCERDSSIKAKQKELQIPQFEEFSVERKKWAVSGQRLMKGGHLESVCALWLLVKC